MQLPAMTSQPTTTADVAAAEPLAATAPAAAAADAATALLLHGVDCARPSGHRLARPLLLLLAAAATVVNWQRWRRAAAGAAAPAHCSWAHCALPCCRCCCSPQLPSLQEERAPVGDGRKRALGQRQAAGLGCSAIRRSIHLIECSPSDMGAT